MFAPKSILVPTDFSDFSDKALRKAIDIAKQHGSAVFLLHVIDVIQQCAVDYCLEYEIVKQLEDNSMNSARGLMKKQLERFGDAGSVSVTTDVRSGTAYEQIIKEAKDRNIDLIVIASHGKRGFIENLLGSVAEKVSKSAPCEVLLVKS